MFNSLAIVILSLQTISAEEMKFIRQFGSSSSDYAYGLSVDNSGNIYIVGATWGILPGTGQISSRNIDGFICKYDSSGKAFWTRQFGSSDYDYAYGVSVDDLGNIYIVGSTNGTLPGQVSAGESDAFIRKYDSSGNALWTKQFGSSDYDYACGVSGDNAGNVYVVGGVTGALPGQNSSGDRDAFIRKYDGSGKELWTKQFGSSSKDNACDILVDSSGNIYVAGDTAGAFPGERCSGGMDVFIRKYDNSGKQLWTRQFGSSRDDWTCGVSIDDSGDIYVVGDTWGRLPGQTSFGETDGFIRKYDSSGNVVWTKQIGTSWYDEVLGVAVGISGNIYITGWTGGSLPGQKSAGESDAFICKYDSSGEELWAEQFGSSDNDYAGAVTIDGSGNVYIAGETAGALPGQTSAGGLLDVFVVKFKLRKNE